MKGSFQHLSLGCCCFRYAPQQTLKPLGKISENEVGFMKLKVLTGIALFFLVFWGSDFLLIIFKEILGHSFISSSLSSIYVYKLAISTLYALCAVVASVVVSSGIISSPKTKTYFAALAAAIICATSWLLFRLFTLKSYIQDDPTAMLVSFHISIGFINKIIIHADICILLLVLMAFGYRWFKPRRKEH